MRRASERCPVLVMFGVATAQRDFRLVGCIECNRWTWRGSKREIELPEADVEALKAAAKRKERYI